MSDVKKKRIIDYETAGEVNEDFYLLGDNGTEGTFKIPVKAVGPIESICPVYDAEAGTYDEGDYCFHDQKMYQCNTDISVPEDFDPTKWDEVTIAEIMASQQSEISTLNSNLAQKANSVVIVNQNDSTATFNIGQYTALIFGGRSGNGFLYLIPQNINDTPIKIIDTNNVVTNITHSNGVVSITTHTSYGTNMTIACLIMK